MFSYIFSARTSTWSRQASIPTNVISFVTSSESVCDVPSRYIAIIASWNRYIAVVACQVKTALAINMKQPSVFAILSSEYVYLFLLDCLLYEYIINTQMLANIQIESAGVLYYKVRHMPIKTKTVTNRMSWPCNTHSSCKLANNSILCREDWMRVLWEPTGTCISLSIFCLEHKSRSSIFNSINEIRVSTKLAAQNLSPHFNQGIYDPLRTDENFHIWQVMPRWKDFMHFSPINIPGNQIL
jgi:hypothetical protein